MNQERPRAGRIIIVDDDRDTRDILRMALEMEGYETLVAANGLRLIASLEVDRPDLIILDVVMSWINGVELCHSIKRNPEFQKIPVLFVSGRTSPEDIARGLEAGAEGYLCKPLDLEALLARVRALIGPGDASLASPPAPDATRPR